MDKDDTLVERIVAGVTVIPLVFTTGCMFDPTGLRAAEGIDEDVPNSPLPQDPEQTEVLDPEVEFVDSYLSMEEQGFFTDYLPNPGNDDISSHDQNIVPDLNRYIDDAVHSANRDDDSQTFYREMDFRTFYEFYTTDPSTIEDEVLASNIDALRESFRLAFGEQSDAFLGFINSPEGVYAGLDIDGRFGMGLITDSEGSQYFVMALRGIDENSNYFIGLALEDVFGEENQEFVALAEAYRAAFSRRRGD